MATILLTDEEYNYIKGLMNDLTGRVQAASPRAATHYTAVAKMHGDFLAREDGKRAISQMKASTRDTILQAKQARRNGTAAPAQAPTGKPNAAPNSKSA